MHFHLKDSLREKLIDSLLGRTDARTITVQNFFSFTYAGPIAWNKLSANTCSEYWYKAHQKRNFLKHNIEKYYLIFVDCFFHQF